MRPLLAIALLSTLLPRATSAGLSADGVEWLPVVVVVKLEGGLTAKGLEVRLIDAGEGKFGGYGDDAFRLIRTNLGKPVQTDINSSALVWMASSWSSSRSDNRSTFKRQIQGTLVIGSEKEPYFKRPLRELLEDPVKAEEGKGPLMVIVEISKKQLMQGATGAEQPGTGQPATRPVDKPEAGDKPQPEAEGRCP